MGDRRIALLLDVVDHAFDRRAWTGTGLWGSLRGLTPREALWRPGRRRHNIWEIVLHTAYWKYIVRRRLTRDVTLAFPRPGSNWPALPATLDGRAWRRDVSLLEDQHRLLRTGIARFPAARLRAKGSLSTWVNVHPIYCLASPAVKYGRRIHLMNVLARR